MNDTAQETTAVMATLVEHKAMILFPSWILQESDDMLKNSSYS